MPQHTPIGCDLHDHLELACLRGYQLTLTLRDGSKVSGKAITTRTGTDKVEYLCVAVDGQRVEVPTHELVRLVVTTAGALFEELEFTNRGAAR